MTGTIGIGEPVPVVLAHANVLYSRVLRDYLLYADEEELISIAWSAQILGEVTEHLVANIPGFTAASGERLVHAMNIAFPYAQVVPTPAGYRRPKDLHFPDEDDRHVLAAALAAEATVLCTSNTKDFPDHLAASVGLDVQTPDRLLAALISEFEIPMLAVHARVVAGHRGATGESTIAALRQAGAPRSAALMAGLLAGDR